MHGNTFFPTSDPSVGNSNNNMSAMKTHEMLEEENDRMVEQMAGKVAALKSVSYFQAKLFSLSLTIHPDGIC